MFGLFYRSRNSLKKPYNKWVFDQYLLVAIDLSRIKLRAFKGCLHNIFNIKIGVKDQKFYKFDIEV